MRVIKFIVGPIKTNCYLLISGKEAVIIDPGGEVENLAKSVEHAALRYIILTHYHFDHTLGIKELKSLFPQAQVLLHQADCPYLDLEVDRELADGGLIVFGDSELKVVHTPGHSAGGICLLAANDIFTGDTLFADGMIGRTDLPGSDPAAMEKSLARLKTIIKPGMQVHPGHGREFVYESL